MVDTEGCQLNAIVETGAAFAANNYSFFAVYMIAAALNFKSNVQGWPRTFLFKNMFRYGSSQLGLWSRWFGNHCSSEASRVGGRNIKHKMMVIL